MVSADVILYAEYLEINLLIFVNNHFNHAAHDALVFVHICMCTYVYEFLLYYITHNRKTRCSRHL